MKGVINKGIEELVREKFGDTVWNSVKEKADCNEPLFLTSQDYPDEMTLSLVQALSAETGLSVDTILIEFGKFWISNTGRNSYTRLFKMMGKNSKEFIQNINKAHNIIAQTIPNAHPPSFKVEIISENEFRLHYFSGRMLCPVVIGLIQGVGIYFNESLNVEEIACMKKGAQKCIMKITFL